MEYGHLSGGIEQDHFELFTLYEFKQPLTKHTKRLSCNAGKIILIYEYTIFKSFAVPAAKHKIRTASSYRAISVV